MAKRNLNPIEIRGLAEYFIREDRPRAKRLVSMERRARVLFTTADIDRTERMVDRLSLGSKKRFGTNLPRLFATFLGSGVATGLLAAALSYTENHKKT